MPGDMALARGAVFLNSSRILVLESYPLQFEVALEGDLPTPCHALRALVSGPDARNRITIDLYSMADPGVVCTQVLKPFSANIHLGSFPRGHYSVWMNGGQAGEFDS